MNEINLNIDWLVDFDLLENTLQLESRREWIFVDSRDYYKIMGREGGGINLYSKETEISNLYLKLIYPSFVFRESRILGKS